MSAKPPFYLVWSPQGSGPPRYRHVTEAAAIAEAERLARLNPGREFFVLITTARSIYEPVTTERYNDPEIPF